MAPDAGIRFSRPDLVEALGDGLHLGPELRVSLGARQRGVERGDQLLLGQRRRRSQQRRVHHLRHGPRVLLEPAPHPPHHLRDPRAAAVLPAPRPVRRRPRRRRRRPRERRRRGRRRRVVRRRAPPRQQLQQDHPEREHVPLLRRPRPCRARLRCSVPGAPLPWRRLRVRDGAAEESARGRRRRLGERGVLGAAGDGEEANEAEVGDAGGEVGVEEDVGRLDLAVDEPARAALVEVRQPARRALGDLQPRRPRQRRLPAPACNASQQRSN